MITIFLFSEIFLLRWFMRDFLHKIWKAAAKEQLSSFLMLKGWSKFIRHFIAHKCSWLFTNSPLQHGIAAKSEPPSPASTSSWIFSNLYVTCVVSTIMKGASGSCGILTSSRLEVLKIENLFHFSLWLPACFCLPSLPSHFAFGQPAHGLEGVRSDSKSSLIESH